LVSQEVALISEMTDFPETDGALLDVRVLIVEDEAIIAHDVALMVEELGYSVAGIASSAKTAVAFAEKDLVDIVLMDIRIKGDVDGINLAAQLRQTYRLPVVYMTAHTDDVTLERARATEPFGYIAKPLTSADIKVALSIALQRHRIQWKAEERESSLRAAIENLEQSQHHLTRSTKMLSVLTEAIAGDFRDPVHAVRVSAEALAAQNRTNGCEDGSQHLLAISDGCRHIDLLIESLMEYFRASSVERKGAQPIQASGPLRTAMEKLSSVIESSHAVIDIGEMPSVLVHPVALTLIFQNLLANSIKFCGDRSPLIFISAQQAGDFWQFTVKDHGVGFDALQAERIFQLFQRAHGRDYAGTGLGLAICERLVTEHGGKIWAESQQNEGAQFHFTVPSWLTNLAA
jgi:signal transduction histidine kinase